MPDLDTEVDTALDSPDTGGGLDSLLGMVDDFTPGEVQQADKGGDTTEADRLAAERAKTEAEQRQQIDKGGDKTYPATVKGEKARTEFDNLKRLKDTAEREREEWKSKHTELEGKYKAHPELTTLKAERDAALKERDELRAKAEDLGKVVALKAIEETDDFIKSVTAPRNAARGEIQSIAKVYGLDMQKLSAIADLPDKHSRWKAIRELCTETDADPQDLKKEIETYCDTFTKEKALREEQNGNQEFASRKQQEKEAQTRIQRQTDWKAGHEQVKKDFETKLPKLLAEEGIAPIWTKAVTEAATMTVEDFEKMPASQKAFYITAGKLLGPIIKHLRAQRDDERAVTAKRNGARPGGGRGAGEQEVPEQGLSGLAAMIDNASFS